MRNAELINSPKKIILPAPCLYPLSTTFPGPEARALRGKIMRHTSFLGPGGQALLSLRTGGFRCRGARRGARWARLILRKQGRIFDWISFPSDSFSAQRPCFRATSLLLGRKNNPKRWASTPFPLHKALKNDIFRATPPPKMAEGLNRCKYMLPETKR